MQRDELMARVAAARAQGGMALAAALVELAEVEPHLRHRGERVRALTDEATPLCQPSAARELRGRLLLRQAMLLLVEEELDGAVELAERAERELEAAGARDAVMEANVLMARVLIRRRELAAADPLLAVIADQLDEGDESDAAERTAVAFALAVAESSLESGAEPERAEEMFTELLSGVADDDRFLDAAFICHQALALVKLGRGALEGLGHLREVIAIAERVDSLEDELEARLALAGALVAVGDVVSRDEAEHHLARIRRQATDHRFERLHTGALIGQVGLLSEQGKTDTALDCCLEIARFAVTLRDPSRYVGAVALMSLVYQRSGDFRSAYRTIAEGHQALKAKIGDQAEALFLPHLSALADKMGRNKFLQMIDNLKTEGGR